MGLVFKEEPILTQVITEMTCDMCGKSTSTRNGFEYSVIEACWGLDSKKDGEYWECILCESCSDQVRSFIESKGGKIPVVDHPTFMDDDQSN